MTWLPGQSGNPHRNGARPVGSRNRRTTELWELLQKRGDRDPVEFQSQLVTDTSIPLEIRLQAANNIAPYRHSKCGAVPPLRFIENPFTFPHPHPTTPQEVDANVAAINTAYASGTLDYDSTQLMLAGQREFIVSFKAREEVPGNQDIKITGGLPLLPGADVIMPKLNGHEALGLLPPNDPPITPPEDVDAPPVIPPEQESSE